MEREFMFSIVPIYNEQFLHVCWYVCKATLYVSATGLHTRKNNSYVIIYGCLSFYLNCCTFSFPLNMLMFWQFSLLINIKLLTICENEIK